METCYSRTFHTGKHISKLNRLIVASAAFTITINVGCNEFKVAETVKWIKKLQNVAIRKHRAIVLLKA